MGTTGSSSSVAMTSSLPELIARIRSFTPVPLAVGFGIDNRTHFDFVTAAGADGVVIGSKVIKVIQEGSNASNAPATLEAFVRSVSLKGQTPVLLNRPKANGSNEKAGPNGHASPVLPIPPATPANDGLEVKSPGKLPSRFGIFGGTYVPESLVDCLNELETAYVKASNDPAFWKEFEDMYGYMNRPSNLYLAERLTEKLGGAKIWLK